jgi:cobalt-zinc-cadmium efflux system outer membrane protein
VIADANALLIGAELALARERERLLLAARLSQQQWQAAEQRRLASEARARLSRDSLGFFAKSFQMGETDLPTRLRVEQEAFAAERALQRARVEQAAALSDYRQALGLLPE